MNPEWSLQNRDYLIARLVMLGHTQLLAEEAVDRALGELEDRVQADGWQFNGEDHFCRVWLQRARQRAADILRHSRRRPPARPSGLAQEWQTVLRHCLAQLEERQRRVLEMYFFERRKDPEIGRLLWPDEPATTTTSHANRIRHLALAAARKILVEAGMDAQTLDFEYGPLGRLRHRYPEH